MRTVELVEGVVVLLHLAVQLVEDRGRHLLVHRAPPHVVARSVLHDDVLVLGGAAGELARVDDNAARLGTDGGLSRGIRSESARSTTAAEGWGLALQPVAMTHLSLHAAVFVLRDLFVSEVVVDHLAGADANLLEPERLFQAHSAVSAPLVAALRCVPRGTAAVLWLPRPQLARRMCGEATGERGGQRERTSEDVVMRRLDAGRSAAPERRILDSMLERNELGARARWLCSAPPPSGGSGGALIWQAGGDFLE